MECINGQKIDGWNGDPFAYTGKSSQAHGATWLEFVYLDGPRKGQTGETMAPEDKKAAIKRTVREYEEQQAGFRRLHKPRP